MRLESMVWLGTLLFEVNSLCSDSFSSAGILAAAIVFSVCERMCFICDSTRVSDISLCVMTWPRNSKKRLP